MAASELTQHLIRRHDIQCDYTDGLVHGIHKRRYLDEERAYVDRLHHVYGYCDRVFLDAGSAPEQALGGGAWPVGYTLSSLNNLVDELNNAFDNCNPSDWAQIHLTL